MIHVTRLNHEDLILNADLIEMIEATPDTVLTLLTGKKMMVLETPDQVMDRVLAYRQKAGPVLVRPLSREIYHDIAEECNSES